MIQHMAIKNRFDRTVDVAGRTHGLSQAGFMDIYKQVSRKARAIPYRSVSKEFELLPVGHNYRSPALYIVLLLIH